MDLIQKSQMSLKKKAVALKYIEGTEAPMILAKGEGRTASLMLEEAEKKMFKDFISSETLAASSEFAASISGGTEVDADDKKWRISIVKA